MESVKLALVAIEKLAIESEYDRPFGAVSGEDLAAAIAPFLADLPKGLFELTLRPKDLVVAMKDVSGEIGLQNSKQAERLDLVFSTLIAEAAQMDGYVGDKDDAFEDLIIEYAEEIRERISGERQALPEHLSLLDLQQLRAAYEMENTKRPFGGVPDDMLFARLLKDPQDLEIIRDANSDQLDRISESLGDMVVDAYEKDENFGKLLNAFIEETMGRIDETRVVLSEYGDEEDLPEISPVDLSGIEEEVASDGDGYDSDESLASYDSANSYSAAGISPMKSPLPSPTKTAAMPLEPFALEQPSS
jgi:hypothetical protein